MNARKLLLVLLCLLMSVAAVDAQNTANVTLTLVEERRIGTDCPAASALSPDGGTLWMLMHNCGDEGYYLRPFVVGAGGSDTSTTEGKAYQSALGGLEGLYFDGLLSSPLSVGADGTPQLHIYNADGNMESLRPADGSAQVNPALTEQILSITEYPEYAVYNADQSAVAVIGQDGVYILDTQTGSEIRAIEIEGDPYAARPQFSADGQSIDLILPNNPDDPMATAATLYRFSLPDGEPQMEQSLLTSLAWISPNGQYVLLWMGEDELVVTEPATGGVSDFLHMNEEPRTVTECTNGVAFDLSIGDFVWDGFLPPMGINWLPDSSGFVTVNSYRGQGGASDNNVCLFSESRLRRYTVGHEG